jgi:hypothetical protein
MSTFHDLVEADRAIFLNMDEFGTEHDVDGATITVVLEDEQVEELTARKMQGETLYIDGVGYTVDTWLEEMGVTRVGLSLPESW